MCVDFSQLRQVAGCGLVKRVFEARTSVSVLSASSLHNKKGKRRKGKKDEEDELLDLATNTTSEEAEVLL